MGSGLMLAVEDDVGGMGCGMSCGMGEGVDCGMGGVMGRDLVGGLGGGLCNILGSSGLLRPSCEGSARAPGDYARIFGGASLFGPSSGGDERQAGDCRLAAAAELALLAENR